MIASYALALLSAASNAASNVLQRTANREEPPELSMSPRLVVNLVHRPVWLAGFGTVVLSFLLMAAALSMGQLSSVQPIVVLELPLTLVGAAKVFKSHLGAQEWSAVAIMTAGLAGLVAFLSPSVGNKGAAPGIDWIVGSAVTIGVIAACLGASRAGNGAHRPIILGIATGIAFGLTAAYMKGMTTGFADGVIGVVTTWQTYAMIVTGIVGMFLMQNALHSGRLVAAQPGITLADPAVAILWGVVAFDEHVRGGAFLALAVVSAAALAAGAVVLARSPLLERGNVEKEEEEEEEEGTREGAPK
jgi:drug/metabolite transporter (DMT)-like permease